MTVAVASDPAGPPSTSSAAVACRPEGLYVHVPFCVSLCPYCDFVVYAGAATRGPTNRIETFLEALITELALRADVLDSWPRSGAPVTRLDSVYLGGGTPSLLPAYRIAGLLELIAERYGLAADAEITLEANPGPDEIGDLAGFRAAGVTRLSIGAQSMHVGELRGLGRRHAPSDVVAAVRAAREAGIGSVNLDLLTDIPGQSVQAWRDTLAQALALEPDHLSVYTLTLDDPDAEGLTGPDGDHLPVPAGARMWRARSRVGQSQDRAAQMETLTDELAARAGLQRYEIANLARPGHESRHNLLYWRRRPFAAVGPGAHASDGRNLRTWNAARLDGYVAALASGRLPPGGAERVDAAMAKAEAAMLGLRVCAGIDAALANDEHVAPALAWGDAAGLVLVDADGARLTARGRLLANEVFMRLLPEPPRERREPDRASAKSQPSL